MSTGALRTRAAVLALVGLLLATLSAWHLARLSPRAAAVALSVLLLPWLALLPGLVGRRRRSYQVGAILTAPYLTYGLTEVLANPGARAYAGTTVLTAFAVFVALVHALRVGTAPRAPADPVSGGSPG